MDLVGDAAVAVNERMNERVSMQLQLQAMRQKLPLHFSRRHFCSARLTPDRKTQLWMHHHGMAASATGKEG